MVLGNRISPFYMKGYNIKALPLGQIQKVGYVDSLGQRLSDSIERIELLQNSKQWNNKLNNYQGRSSREISSNSQGKTRGKQIRNWTHGLKCLQSNAMYMNN